MSTILFTRGVIVTVYCVGAVVTVKYNVFGSFVAKAVYSASVRVITFITLSIEANESVVFFTKPSESVPVI